MFCMFLSLILHLFIISPLSHVAPRFASSLSLVAALAAAERQREAVEAEVWGRRPFQGVPLPELP